MRYKAADCYSAVKRKNDEIEQAIYRLEKNRNDMDFENTQARREVDRIVAETITALRTLRGNLNAKYFE